MLGGEGTCEQSLRRNQEIVASADRPGRAIGGGENGGVGRVIYRLNVTGARKRVARAQGLRVVR